MPLTKKDKNRRRTEQRKQAKSVAKAEHQASAAAKSSNANANEEARTDSDEAEAEWAGKKFMFYEDCPLATSAVIFQARDFIIQHRHSIREAAASSESQSLEAVVHLGWIRFTRLVNEEKPSLGVKLRDLIDSTVYAGYIPCMLEFCICGTASYWGNFYEYLRNIGAPQTANDQECSVTGQTDGANAATQPTPGQSEADALKKDVKPRSRRRSKFKKPNPQSKSHPKFNPHETSLAETSVIRKSQEPIMSDEPGQEAPAESTVAEKGPTEEPSGGCDDQEAMIKPAPQASTTQVSGQNEAKHPTARGVDLKEFDPDETASEFDEMDEEFPTLSSLGRSIERARLILASIPVGKERERQRSSSTSIND